MASSALLLGSTCYSLLARCPLPARRGSPLQFSDGFRLKTPYDGGVSTFCVLIIGAYGQFGQRIASELSRDSGLDLILAGRSRQSASALVERLRGAGACARMQPARVDVESADLAHASRWVARCDVPDLEILPSRYPGLRHCDFRAGLELRRMHWGLWLASWAVRARMAPGLERWARPLLRASEWWLQAGSDTGVMSVQMQGIGHAGKTRDVQWQIIASDGSGPQIPATVAIVLARKLARTELPGGGAKPCLDLFTLDEFMHALDSFPIQASTRVVSS